MVASSSIGTTRNFTIGFDLVIPSNVVRNWFFNRMPHSTATIENVLEINPIAGRNVHARAKDFAWVSIVVGAIAMAATYPGRTHGLGMVTEPLLNDFGLNTDDGRVLFASLGFWAQGNPDLRGCSSIG